MKRMTLIYAGVFFALSGAVRADTGAGADGLSPAIAQQTTALVASAAQCIRVFVGSHPKVGTPNEVADAAMAGCRGERAQYSMFIAQQIDALPAIDSTDRLIHLDMKRGMQADIRQDLHDLAVRLVLEQRQAGH